MPQMEFIFIEHHLEDTQGFMKSIFNGVSYLSSLELKFSESEI